ncbi:cdc42 homolog isoform X1 [Cimex lectularius]|uniref:Uncharacterized protein n=1 Tax=Cimex lectularius TaxID=79782 RepID=A0A8I6S4S4_CIMLE|nr:cdc42 homolog isoform X1 [Cimex lectularius]
MPVPPVIKCVVIGNGAVGKTSMLISFTTDEFLPDHVPTIFDHHGVDIRVNGQPYVLNLFDTAGQEEYARLRSLGYQHTNVFLICFSVVNPASFQDVKSKWIQEVRHFCPRARYILVGTQIDLRENEKTLADMTKRRLRPISKNNGERMAKEIGACEYLECSALTKEGVKKVFEEVVRHAVLRPSLRKYRPANCTLY